MKQNIYIYLILLVEYYLFIFFPLRHPKDVA